MKCYMCDKELLPGKEKGFVCICKKCLNTMEKSETRRTEFICKLTKDIQETKNINRDWVPKKDGK